MFALPLIPWYTVAVSANKSSMDFIDYAIPCLISCMAVVVLAIGSFEYSKNKMSLAYMLVFVVAGGLEFLLSIGLLLYRILSKDKKEKSSLIFMIAMSAVIIIAAVMLLLMSKNIIKVEKPSAMQKTVNL